VAYVATNDDHSLLNVGAIPAQYFAMSLGRDK
jgi:hypothetical protein